MILLSVLNYVICVNSFVCILHFIIMMNFIFYNPPVPFRLLI